MRNSEFLSLYLFCLFSFTILIVTGNAPWFWESLFCDGKVLPFLCETEMLELVSSERARISCVSFPRSQKAVERKFLLRDGLFNEEWIKEQNTVFVFSNFADPHCDNPVGLMKRNLIEIGDLSQQRPSGVFHFQTSACGGSGN